MLLVVFLLVESLCLYMPRQLPLAENQNPKPYKGHKISFLVINPHRVAAKALAKWFHAETGAVVEVTTVHYSKILETILMDKQSRQPNVDVYVSWYVDLGKLVESRAVTDITDFIESNKALLKPDDYIPAIYENYTRFHNRRWGLPFDGDTHLLFYRKSILEKYDLEPPDTWPDYLNVAKIITENERDRGIYGCAIMAHPTPLIIVSCFMNRLGGYGGRLMDDDYQPTVDSPEALAALKDMIAQAKYALPTVTETDFAVARDAFLTGQVAMVEQWSDIGIMAEDISQSLIRGDWGVVQMPRSPGLNTRHSPALNAGFFLAISTRARQPEVAKAFLLFASRPDISLRLNLINGGIDPVRISTLKSEAFRQFAPELSRVEQDIIYNATPWPVVPQMPDLLVSITNQLVYALENRKTPEQALKDAQGQWLRLLDSNTSQGS